MFSKLLLRAAFCALSLILTPLLNAQFGANLQGTVIDTSGAVIPGATVTLTNNETRAKQTTKTNQEGFYRFSGLGPGSYTLTGEAPNFAKQELQNVLINAEQTQGINVTLRPGQVTETVTVEGDTVPLLQTENAQIGRGITTREVTSLPQFGRDPY